MTREGMIEALQRASAGLFAMRQPGTGFVDCPACGGDACDFCGSGIVSVGSAIDYIDKQIRSVLDDLIDPQSDWSPEGSDTPF